MNYYYQYHLIFSFHCLQRIRKRIPIFTNENEWIIKEKILKMINNSCDKIETTKNLYIKLNDLKGNFYVIVERHKNLILTVTSIGYKKLLDIVIKN